MGSEAMKQVAEESWGAKAKRLIKKQHGVTLSFELRDEGELMAIFDLAGIGYDTVTEEGHEKTWGCFERHFLKL